MQGGTYQYQYECGGLTRLPMHRDHFLICSALFRQQSCALDKVQYLT
jgi:hypothetical protein